MQFNNFMNKGQDSHLIDDEKLLISFDFLNTN